MFVAYGDGEPNWVWPVTDRVGNVEYGALSVLDDPVQGAVTQLDPILVLVEIHNKRNAVAVRHGPIGWFFPHRLRDHVHERVGTDFRHQPFRVGGVTVMFRAEQPVNFGVDRRGDDPALLRVEGAFQHPASVQGFRQKQLPFLHEVGFAERDVVLGRRERPTQPQAA